MSEDWNFAASVAIYAFSAVVATACAVFKVSLREMGLLNDDEALREPSESSI